MTSVLLAGALLNAFSGKGLLPDATVANVEFLISVGLAAASTVIVATRAGLPVSTTHALIGGLIGAGLAFTPGEIVWSAFGGGYLAPLLISPVLALSITAMSYPCARRTRMVLGIKAASRVELEPNHRLAAATSEMSVPLAYG